ncbi:hypothetical protein PYTT13_09100 [Paracoccus yeei]|uniref:Uncharacterized protein n=1 Tax=Paracoccus yeei TaxID=147645 RepID=A0A2D2C0E9_9RHOB|nr:hypothetical protein PYTT13_09100 [Paracoccus yeei]
MLCPGNGQGERSLWAAVLTTAISDAIRGRPGSLDQMAADRWLRSGTDMLEVASLAGVDGRTVRARYLAGMINPDLLHTTRRASMEAAE